MTKKGNTITRAAVGFLSGRGTKSQTVLQIVPLGRRLVYFAYFSCFSLFFLNKTNLTEWKCKQLVLDLKRPTRYGSTLKSSI